MLRIVADENIPFVNELFAGFGDVRLRPGREICARDVRDADVLLVRSVTKVNADLLAGSAVKFVGTCTIGTDHLDTVYLSQCGIAYASAPGCNADSVVQYVLAALAQLQRLTAGQRVLVIGGGNVGSRVYRGLEKLGMDCYCVDPFLSSESSSLRLVDMAMLTEADIVCMHTPYTRTGPHPTHHLLDAKRIATMKSGALLLNAGRGAAVDNRALLQFLQQNASLRVVLDVWEDEPALMPDLLARVDIGTPHIAGYSYEGKISGSLMIFDRLCEFLAHDGAVQREAICLRAFGEKAAMAASTLAEAILTSYPIGEDDAKLRGVVAELPAAFDKLRKHYPVRREFSHYRCRPQHAELAASLAAIGFSVDGD